MENNTNNSQYEIENPPITFKDILQKIIRGRWWILSSGLICLLITTYITFSTPPIYDATASVMIEKSSRAQTIFNFGGDDNFKISDEIAVINSRTIAEDVVEQLWNSNKRNRLYVFGTKKFIPRGQRVRRFFKKIITFGKWNEEQDKPPQFDSQYTDEIGAKYYKNILNTLQIYSKRGTNILQIKARSPHPHEAALIANLVAKVYKIRDKEWSSNESKGLKFFLQERLDEKEFEMEQIDSKIEKYKMDNQIYDIDGNVANLMNNLTNLESEYNNSNLEKNILYSQRKYITEKLSDIEEDLTEQMLSSINAQLLALREQVNEKEAELVRNSTIYGEGHEAVVKITQNLKSLKAQLELKTDELIAAGLSIVDPLEYRQGLIGDLLKTDTDLNLLNSKMSEYQLLIIKYQDQVKMLPEKQSYLGKMSREKEVLANTYSYMRQKMEEARVSMASEPGKVRIIDRAEIRNRPISPDISRNLIMAIIVGAFIGLTLNILIEYFDNTVKSVEFIENKKIPVLAIIPSIDSELESYKGSNYNKFTKKIKNHLKIDSTIQRRLVTHEDPRSPISEAYRGLRTSLMYTSQNNNGVIMVSSPGPGEGKTTTIINLAITYANLGKKTLLIDGDLRKPVLHKVFDIKNELGLTHYLSGLETKWQNIVSPTDIDNLSIIYSGAIPPNPSELLGSDGMVNLLEELKSSYDIILFDAPPIMAVTDAVVLSRLIDKFILVVRFGITDKTSVNHTLISLANVNTELTGIVFNDLNRKNSYYSQNYYRYHQYYYTSDDAV